MNPTTHKTRLEGAVADRNLWRISTLGLVVANLLIASGWLMSTGNERTILIPTEIRKSFWVEGGDVSQEYLEQMALYFLQLGLNVTPGSIDYQAETFLKYVDPAAQGALKTQMLLEAQRIKRVSGAQTFFPREIFFDMPKQRVAVRGELVKFVGEQKVKTEGQTWRVTFAYGGGKLAVTEFMQVSDDDPFEAKPKKKRDEKKAGSDTAAADAG